MADRILARNIVTNTSKLIHRQASCSFLGIRTAPSRSYVYTTSAHTTPHPERLPSLLAIQYHYPQSVAAARSSPARILFQGSIHSSHVAPTMRLVQIRPFSTSRPALDDSGLHFDTHRFVEKLEAQGFTREQSEGIVNTLDEVITDSMNNLTKNMVTRADQDKTVYTYKVDFASLKSELQMLEKNDFSLTNTNNERLVSEIEKLRQRLREEIARTQAGVRLDLNLEKGRIRDEAATQELKVRAIEEKFHQEVASLRTQIEVIKLQTLQYMIGTITGAGALMLAYLRMFK